MARSTSVFGIAFNAVHVGAALPRADGLLPVAALVNHPFPVVLVNGYVS